MIYSLFYRHYSFFTVFWVSSFYLSLNIVALHQFTVTCIEKWSERSSQKEKGVWDSYYVFGSSTTFQRSKERICENRCQVNDRLHVFAGFFWPYKPFRDYSLCSVSILHSVCILPLVCSPQSSLYIDRFSIAWTFLEWNLNFELCNPFSESVNCIKKKDVFLSANPKTDFWS